MKYVKTHGKTVAAAKAGMSPKTAKKYIDNPALAGKPQEPRQHRTRVNPFEDDLPDIDSLLKGAPGLEAKTIMDWLMEKSPGKYHVGQLRSLQRYCKEWRALKGPDRNVIFPQIIKPGRQSQSDWTNMNALKITIGGQPFQHLLFHFMLPYSRWETVSIAFSESFDSLVEGYEKAVWELGRAVPDHRTDNLSAATHRMGSSREFNDSWLEFLQYYKVSPSRNNPGESHENGAVEKSHDLFKNMIDQQLMIRGSRDFANTDEYEDFLKKVTKWRNHGREKRLEEEYKILKPLPERRWNAPKITPVRVLPSSTVNIQKCTYSVPSRLISLELRAYIYPTKIKLHYGDKCVHSMPKLPKGDVAVNYRHIVTHLIRKPGAFENYQYREHLFPRLVFRQTYDACETASTKQGHKNYLKILQLAASTNEEDVSIALELLLEAGEVPSVTKVKELIKEPKDDLPTVKIDPPNLSQYDSLLCNMEVEHANMH